jgi:hypothetical protein
MIDERHVRMTLSAEMIGMQSRRVVRATSAENENTDERQRKSRRAAQDSAAPPEIREVRPRWAK